MASKNDYEKVRGTKKEPKAPARTMGLGALKGSTNGKERQRRLEAAIDADTGYTPKPRKKK